MYIEATGQDKYHLTTTWGVLRREGQLFRYAPGPSCGNAAGTCSIGTTTENDCLEGAWERVEEVMARSLQLRA